MKKPRRKPKRIDVNQRVAVTTEAVTGEPSPAKDPAAVALGRKGGLKGGTARAASMTAVQRSEAARKAALARWGKAKNARKSK